MCWHVLFFFLRQTSLRVSPTLWVFWSRHGHILNCYQSVYISGKYSTGQARFVLNCAGALCMWMYAFFHFFYSRAHPFSQSHSSLCSSLSRSLDIFHFFSSDFFGRNLVAGIPWYNFSHKPPWTTCYYSEIWFYFLSLSLFPPRWFGWTAIAHINQLAWSNWPGSSLLFLLLLFFSLSNDHAIVNVVVVAFYAFFPGIKASLHNIIKINIK